MIMCAGVGYRLNEKTVSHLLYVDDLVRYTCNPQYMEKCKDIIERFSKYVCMYFGLDKYTVVHTKCGVILNHLVSQ